MLKGEVAIPGYTQGWLQGGGVQPAAFFCHRRLDPGGGGMGKAPPITRRPAPDSSPLSPLMALPYLLPGHLTPATDLCPSGVHPRRWRGGGWVSVPRVAKAFRSPGRPDPLNPTYVLWWVILLIFFFPGRRVPNDGEKFLLPSGSIQPNIKCVHCHWVRLKPNARVMGRGCLLLMFRNVFFFRTSRPP